MGRRFNCQKKGCKPDLNTSIHFINMPPRAKQAKQRRGNGNQRFIDLKNDFSSLPSEENLINLSEFIETLIGEDDWCGQDIEEKNVVDLTDVFV